MLKWCRVQVPFVRVFTPDEADGIVPKVRPLLERAREAALELNDRNELVQTLLHRHGADQLENPANPSYARYWRAVSDAADLQTELEDLLEQVAFAGAEVKNVREGLIDFYTIVDGEPAYLCWKLGEPGIGHWHGLAAGFAGRKPIERLTEHARR